MKIQPFQMDPDTIYEARRMSDGGWIRGQVVGAEPFIYILTQENYDKSIATHIDKEEYRAKMRLIRVIGNSLRKVDRFARSFIPEDKNDAEFGVGDIVRGKCKDGLAFDGRIFHIDIKKEEERLHPIMFVSQLADSQVEEFGHAAIWIDDITELEILRFKEEEVADQKEGSA